MTHEEELNLALEQVKVLKKKAKELGKGLTLLKSQIDDLREKEDLFYSFIRFMPSIPSEKDCNHYKSLTTHRMSHINGLLKSGFSFKKIKCYSIWKGICK